MDSERTMSPSDTKSTWRDSEIDDTSDESRMDDSTCDQAKDTKIAEGMISEAKNLYENKASDWGSPMWVEEYPEDLAEPVENESTDRYALLIRNKRCVDGRRKLEIHSIKVQSPLLKAVLGRVLVNYPGITTSLRELTFTPPFEPFVHRWANLVAALNDEQDQVTKRHLELLHGVLAEEIRDNLKAKEDYIANGVITFDTCWLLFEPGTIVLRGRGDERQALRSTKGEYGMGFTLTCESVDWDGIAFGIAKTYAFIAPFSGTKAIIDLDAYPLQYHPNAANLEEELIERGKIFEKFSGHHYKQYNGIATGSGPWGSVVYNVDSRIIIDTHAWNRFNPNSRVSVDRFGGRPARQPKAHTGGIFDGTDYGDGDEDPDDSHDEDEGVDTRLVPGTGKIIQHLPASLTRDQLLICDGTVRGYSLKNKKWLTFSVENISDIRWNEQAFDRLVLPDDHKDLILALIESQVANKDTFDDVIQGKGKGMIMLLSGPPGVGKTLTAESVSEVIRAPLYTMSAGDLGLSSSEVESSLSNVLEMCTKWNAVLLIDEADVFLEQRSAHDLVRNKLVSIFLRLLEYYEGILFLTTNRVESIDTAFQSRIHVSIAYSELSCASRRHVWANFSGCLSSADLDKLSQYQMNGREIKNVLKTAQLFAARKKEDLAVRHVECVLAIDKRQIGVGEKDEGGNVCEWYLGVLRALSGRVSKPLR